MVGAGPGDAELMTLKALRVVQQADAVIYDRLVSDEVLALIPTGVARFFAGKSCKGVAMTQAEINELMVTLAKKGMNVVRLKGGDPGLFGRAGEEALHLTENNIPFEIVPGITSAQGCAAAAGIPLTHRGLATGVRYFTGHRMTKEDADGDLELDWKSLADPDTTLVVYMGLANLGMIAKKLIVHGLAADTPAAAIAQGATSRQRVILSSLRNIDADTKAANLEPPTLIIIGKVVSLAEINKHQHTENKQYSRKIVI